MVIQDNRIVLQFKFFFARARAHAFELHQNPLLKSARFVSTKNINKKTMKTQTKRRIAMPVKTLKDANIQMLFKAYRRPALVAMVSVLFLAALSRIILAGDDSVIKLGTSDGSTTLGIQGSVSATDVVSINSLGGVTISSTVVMPGTTFYQNGTATISSATISVNALYGAGQQPTLVGTVCGAGSTLRGTNNFGKINCVGTVASGVLFTVTQTIAAPNMWNCIVMPANTNANYAASPHFTVFVSTTDNLHWTLNTTANFAATNYLYNYMCGGY